MMLTRSKMVVPKTGAEGRNNKKRKEEKTKRNQEKPQTEDRKRCHKEMRI